ncbi:C-type lectin domain family 5 member A-like isoform X3 [Tiliqua scincoides]|uniref:C-type lectin domain family 5 member A-like isoform X3 n=1 Tax=Tiliqua scincoides TaxID=71010 RepID=UPI00346208AE
MAHGSSATAQRCKPLMSALVRLHRSFILLLCKKPPRKEQKEKSWHNSRNDCTQSNADLAIVNSNEELTFLKTRTENADYFVGLTKTSGMWKWIDNTDLDQNIFSITNRDNDCAVVGLSTTGTVPCSVPTRWICEKNA